MASKKILLAPLDWGLGHATRCIPVIHELLNTGHEVLIAADGKGEHLLREEFPDLKFIYLKGYRLSYSSIFPAWLKIFFQIPKIVWRMIVEHEQLKKIIREHKIDVIISDNRFGLWNKKIRSVYITHQLMIKVPKGLKMYEPLIQSAHNWIIKKYSHCWIPDYAGTENLSGDLSHKYPLLANATFVNPLSRFAQRNAEQNFEYDLCIIISGLEPARSAFEKIILSQLDDYSTKTILILGKPGHKQDEIIGNVRIVSHLNASALEKTICASRFVICRSGYSGIMDLIALGKDALLVPTPGQTEQEYLAEYLSSKKIFASIAQSKFNLKDAVANDSYSVKNLPANRKTFSPLSQRIQQL